MSPRNFFTSSSYLCKIARKSKDNERNAEKRRGYIRSIGLVEKVDMLLWSYIMAWKG